MQLTRPCWFVWIGMFPARCGSSELFLHTEKVLFVDQNGRLRGVYNGSLSFEVEKLIVDIELLSM